MGRGLEGRIDADRRVIDADGRRRSGKIRFLILDTQFIILEDRIYGHYRHSPSMLDRFRYREAVVACEDCGERAPVVIWSHGAIHPVDCDEICSCDEVRLRIVSDDLAVEKGAERDRTRPES